MISIGDLREDSTLSGDSSSPPKGSEKSRAPIDLVTLSTSSAAPRVETVFGSSKVNSAASGSEKSRAPTDLVTLSTSSAACAPRVETAFGSSKVNSAASGLPSSGLATCDENSAPGVWPSQSATPGGDFVGLTGVPGECSSCNAPPETASIPPLPPFSVRLRRRIRCRCDCFRVICCGVVLNPPSASRRLELFIVDLLARLSDGVVGALSLASGDCTIRIVSIRCLLSAPSLRMRSSIVPDGGALACEVALDAAFGAIVEPVFGIFFAAFAFVFEVFLGFPARCFSRVDAGCGLRVRINDLLALYCLLPTFPGLVVATVSVSGSNTSNTLRSSGLRNFALAAANSSSVRSPSLRNTASSCSLLTTSVILCCRVSPPPTGPDHQIRPL